MQIQSERSYESAALCREELPSVIRRMNQSGKSVGGRCAPVADQPSGVDPMVTGSIERTLAEISTATVRVTRNYPDGQQFVDEYVVPKE